MQLVDDNMVGMFVNNNFLGVIVLGAAFGVALTRLTQKSKWTCLMLLPSHDEIRRLILMLFCNLHLSFSAVRYELGPGINHPSTRRASPSVYVVRSLDYQMHALCSGFINRLRHWCSI